MLAHENQDDLDSLWSRLLSRDPQMVRSAFYSLSEGEQKAVIKHLERMSTEPGWHPAQQASAEAALKTLRPERKSAD